MMWRPDWALFALQKKSDKTTVFAVEITHFTRGNIVPGG